MKNTEQIVIEKRDIGFRIGGINVGAYSCDLDSVNFDDLVERQAYPFNVQMLFAVTQDLLGIAIRTDVTMKLKQEDEFPVLRIATDTVFQLKNLEDYVIEGGKVSMPESIMSTLISISISTTRGILFAKNVGTPFQKVLMPLFNIAELIPQNPLAITDASLINPLPPTAP